MKKKRELERIVRGFANHRRIEILNLLAKHPELSVFEVSKILDIEYKTAAEHLRRLTIARLIMKRSDGVAIRHKLSPRGRNVLKFLRTLE